MTEGKGSELKREALDKVAVSYCDNQGDIYGSVTPCRVIIMGDMEGSPQDPTFQKTPYDLQSPFSSWQEKDKVVNEPKAFWKWCFSE